MSPRNFSIKWLAVFILVLCLIPSVSCSKKEKDTKTSSKETKKECSGGKVLFNDTCIIPACSENPDCDDHDNCTTDICNNAGDANAVCSHAPNVQEEIYGDEIDNDCDGATDEDLRINGDTVIVLSENKSFDACDLRDKSRIETKESIYILCDNLKIGPQASIIADNTGDSGKCDGNPGNGGGDSASGGGGGGGCYAAAGGSGGTGQWRQVSWAGKGGSTIYDSSAPDLLTGSRGGKGGGINDIPGFGGGAIYIKVTDGANIEGLISANGGEGGNGSWDDGGSGGGSGGIIVLEAGTITLGPSALLSAKGGKGGDSDTGGGAGGGGGGGFIKLKYNSKTFSDSNFSVAGGEGGKTAGGGGTDGKPGAGGIIVEF